MLSSSELLLATQPMTTPSTELFFVRYDPKLFADTLPSVQPMFKYPEDEMSEFKLVCMSEMPFDELCPGMQVTHNLDTRFQAVIAKTELDALADTRYITLDVSSMGGGGPTTLVMVHDMATAMFVHVKNESNEPTFIIDWDALRSIKRHAKDNDKQPIIVKMRKDGRLEISVGNIENSTFVFNQ